MAKYRTLTIEELNLFEKEFVDFLVVNGVTADDWVKIKEEDETKASGLIELFSDLVFDKILAETQFLESKEEAVWQAIQCQSDKMFLVALQRTSSDVDLNSVAVSSLTQEQFEIVKGKKTYSKSREEDIFELISKGYAISDGTLFKQLILTTV